MTIPAEAKPAKKLTRKMAREPKAQLSTGSTVQSTALKTGTGSAKVSSKAAAVLAMLQRADGATIEQLAATTGWLPHTTRAALTGLNKKWHVLASEKVEGGARIYRVTTAPVTDVAAVSA